MQSVKAYKKLTLYTYGAYESFLIFCTLASCGNCPELVKDVFGNRIKLHGLALITIRLTIILQNLVLQLLN